MSIRDQLIAGLRVFRAARADGGLYFDKLFVDAPAPSHCSTAATGFGLVCLCIEAEVGPACFDQETDFDFLCD